MARKLIPPPALPELEAEVMEIVWERGSATVRDALCTLNRGHKKRAYTTVMTIMNRLELKGMLSRARQGRSDCYTPAIGREQYMNARAEAEVKMLVDDFGDVALAHFARRVGDLDRKRIEELKKLAGNE